MGNSIITDMDIQALVDGEIPAEKRICFLEAIHQSPDLYRRYLTYTRQKELLRKWWKDH